MTTCDVPTARLLEADGDELRGSDRTDLGAHVAGCDRCRALAATILEDERLLRDGLRELQPSSRSVASLAPRRAPRFGRLPRQLWPALATAAAATFLVVLIGRAGARRELPPSLPLAQAPARQIEVQPSRNAVVMNTDNPDITVVWIY